MAYVPQNIELFSGTIRENIVLGKDNATYDDIKSACENASCNYFIEKMPAKYDSYLDEAGGGLSGGERQRLSLARALIKKSKFLILDEATSNLDFISEAKIYNTLFVKGKDLTMLIIAHRLSTIRNCDLIYVLDKGAVVEVGDHETLLNKKGYYYRLYESQVGEIKTKTIDEGQENIEIIETKEKATSVKPVKEGEDYEYN
ncbi:ATP-binding cassette domain-containing protein [Clostridium vincentii]|uniref:Putative multidrug export ATP-binding/permease protein n=1 Tax=Clostridium vincentii TaxID=52704 RepID=A0A2T0BHX9_9CLOT|nr:putative multidrug export ATP-binding/permease protein [Clostridium vincentii]